MKAEKVPLFGLFQNKKYHNVKLKKKGKLNG